MRHTTRGRHGNAVAARAPARPRPLRRRHQPGGRLVRCGGPAL